MSPPSNENLIDWELVLEGFDGDRELLCEVASIASKEIGSLAAELENELGSQDGNLIRRLAHTIRGSARALRAERVSLLASIVEEAAGSNKFQVVEQTWPDLKQAIVQIQAEIKTFVD